MRLTNIKKYIFLILAITLISTNLISQTEIQVGNYTHWYVDNHGYIYLQWNNKIAKLDREGKTRATWNSPKNKTITTFDASNPLQILVFHIDSYQITLLDNNLIEVSSNIDLTQTGLNDIIAMCQSSRGDMWALDRQTSSIYSIQKNMTINYSFSINHYCNVNEIIKIVEYNQQLWLLQTNHNYIVIDNFGQFIKRHIVKGIENAQISKSIINICSDNNIYTYKPGISTLDTISTNKKAAKGCFLYNSVFYLFRENTIEISLKK